MKLKGGKKTRPPDLSGVRGKAGANSSEKKRTKKRRAENARIKRMEALENSTENSHKFTLNYRIANREFFEQN